MCKFGIFHCVKFGISGWSIHWWVVPVPAGPGAFPVGSGPPNTHDGGQWAQGGILEPISRAIWRTTNGGILWRDRGEIAGTVVWTWVDFFNLYFLRRLFSLVFQGNASVTNNDNTIGAVGFLSRILPFVYPVMLIRVNGETGEPLRDSKGMAIRCQPGEPGELVGRIKSSGIHM